MPIPRIPDDLIYDIVDQIPGLYRSYYRTRAGDATEGKLRAQLVACCLTSRAFLARARPLLYEEVSLHFASRLPSSPRGAGVRDDVVQLRRSSAQALSIVMNPHLERLVRRVDLDVMQHPQDFMDNNLPALALATTLRNAPNLRELEMIVSYNGLDETCLPPIYGVIANLQPFLRSLDIVWYAEARDGVAARSPALFPLLSKLPCLEFLLLHNLHIPSIPPELSFPFLLKRLDLMVEGPGSATAFDALTSNSSETLIQLRLAGKFKCNLRNLSALRMLTFGLSYDSALITDSAILQRRVTLAVRDNIRPTIATVPTGLIELCISDYCETISPAVFTADFFAKIPRSIANVALTSVRLEAESILGLLLKDFEAAHKRPSELRRVYCTGEVTGDTEAMVARFNKAGVSFRTGSKAEAKANQEAP